MTPEQEKMLTELYTWMQERKVQQISLPIDEASRNALQSATFVGSGSTTKTQSVSVPSTPTNITVPAAYVQTVLLSINGVTYEIPSII